MASDLDLDCKGHLISYAFGVNFENNIFCIYKNLQF